MRTIDGSDIPITADTVCVHGVGRAVALVKRLRETLVAAGIAIAAP